MLNSKNNTFHNIDFSAIKTSYEEVLKGAIEKYWEKNVDITLQAVNDYRELRQELLIKNLDFFSSRINVENHSPIIIRFSKTFCKNFLQVSLDENHAKDKSFQLSSLTSLEIKILNNFAEFLYKKTDSLLISPKEKKMSDESLKNINLIFSIKLEKYRVVYLMISIPKDRLELKNLEKITSFEDDDFLTSNTYVNIKAGDTKVTLDELKNLAKDDILILENSKYTKLILISGNFEQSFNVKVNPDMIISIDNDDSNNSNDNNYNIQNEVTMNKNLWDDIQIEINAEFEKVKMTIGELKQITKGQVIDLGSIFNNEISLYVEDKKVAKGELLIINDKYAVKLNEVLANSAKKISPVAKEQPSNPTPKAQEKNNENPENQDNETPKITPPEANSEDEEFDYSDFEK